MFTRKRAIAFCTVIATVIILQLLVNIVGDSKALADSIPITYNGSASQANGSQYSKSGNLTMNSITLDAGLGKTIQDAYFVSGTTKTPIPGATGQQKFVVRNATVQQIAVTSGANDTAKGYYAWYRYTPGDSHGVNWYEQGGKNLTCGIPDGAPKEYVNGTAMPVYPNCTDDQLSLGGTLTYKEGNGNEIPVDEVVLPAVSDFKVNISKDIIYGPDSLNGKTWGNTSIIGPEIIDAAIFKIKYSQTFDELGPYEEFSLPGARMTVYFAGFDVSVNSKTFQYPDTVEVTYSDAAAPTPTPYIPTSNYDFTVPSYVNFKDTITIHPLINNGMCLYYSHSYTITKNGGGTWHSGTAPDRDANTTVSYPYPSPFGSGSFQVTMTVKDGCGTHVVGPKPLTIGMNPDNKPPFAKLSWFKAGTTTPITTAIAGDKVYAGVIFDSTSPKDPDGDPVSAKSWDFNASTPWIKSLPLSYNFDFTQMTLNQYVTADTVGQHAVSLTVTDGQGGNYTASAALEVKSPNPVACIAGPTQIKEKRPLPYDFVSCSTSPTNTPIVEEVWTNKSHVYTTPGDEIITLKVQDAVGRWSDTATAVLKVIADKPPIAGATLPNQTTRGTLLNIASTAASPDADNLVRFKYEYKYDATNNGFVDDAWKTLTDSAISDTTFTPDKVGKYLIRQTVWEDYGLSGNTDLQPAANYTIDVVNLPPTVDVQTTGQTSQPKNIAPYNLAAIFNGWNLNLIGGGTADKNNWQVGTAGLGTKITRPLRSFAASRLNHFSQGAGPMDRTIFANAQSNPSIRDLGISWNSGNFSSLAVGLADQKYVYLAGTDMNKVPTIQAYDKNMNLVWTRTYSGYRAPGDNQGTTQKFAMLSYSGRLFAASWTPLDGRFHLITVDPNNGNLINDSAIPDYSAVGYPYSPNWGIFTSLQVLNGKIYGKGFGGDCWEFDTNGNVIRFYPLARSYLGGDATGYNYDQGPKAVEDKNFAYLTTNGISGVNTDTNAALWSVNVNPTHTYLDGNDNLIAVNAPNSFSAKPTVTKINMNGAVLSDSMLDQSDFSEDFQGARQTVYGYSIHVLGVDNTGHLFGTYYPKSLSGGCDVNSCTGFAVWDIITGKMLSHEGYYNALPSFWDFIVGSDNVVTFHSSRGGFDDQEFELEFDPNGNKVRKTALPFRTNETGTVIKIDDQKELFLATDVNNKASIFLADSSSAALTYPKLFSIGTNISDLWSGGSSLTSETAKLNLKPTALSSANSQGIGLAFRIQDAANHYSVEFESGRLRFKRTVGGNASVLGDQAYSLSNNNSFRLKVTPYPGGGGFNVYVNEIYRFSVNEDAWPSGGKIGIIDRGQQGVNFTNLEYESGGGLGGSIAGIVLVNQTVTYNVNFNDPENDKRLTQSESWKYVHNPNVFLNSGGTWAGSGQTFGTPVTSFAKPGEYTFDFRSRDDPNAFYYFPSMVFDDYRQWSNTLTGKIRVHRPPAAQFTMGENPNHTLAYYDTSYDPDRYDPNNGSYSTEATGINYQATRGITERKWRYKKPSDAGYTEGKLLNPPSGDTWTVVLAVKDEYGAWSEWYGQEITTAGPAPVNSPPVAALTYPNGSQNNPNLIPMLRPTVTWNESDADAGADISLYQVVITDQNGNWVYDSGNVPQGTAPQTTSFEITSDLTPGKLYRAYVRIFDGSAWSAWSGPGWFKVNSPPAAVMTYPNGTSGSPTQAATLRPTFKWSQTDRDPGAVFTYFQLQVYDDAANTLILDSGEYYEGTPSTAGSWTPDTDLPHSKKLRVRVRVFDGYVWSNWSPFTYLFINRPPVAEFDWSPKPLWEGDRLQLSNHSSDPDGNALTYEWTIQAPGGAVSHYTTKEVSGILVEPGTYQVRLTVSDGLLTDSVSKNIQAAALTIHSEVNHTPQWLANHQARGHQTDTPPKDFYSGEILMVAADSSPAPVAEVWAALDAAGVDGGDISLSVRLLPDAAGTHFTGELYDPILESIERGLPPGIVNVHFRMIYANGTVKEQDIPIHILDNVNAFLGVHRIR